MSGARQFNAQAEAERLAALRACRILDTPREQTYDDVAMLAALVCQASIATVALIDEKRVWFKASIGLPARSDVMPREASFCQHAIQTPHSVTVVADMTSDARCAADPLVASAPHAVCGALVPIVTADGLVLGAVCVLDCAPREFSAQQRACLQALGRQVSHLLEWRRHDSLPPGRDEVDQAGTANEYLQALSTVALDLKSIVDRNYVYRHVNAMYLQYWQKRRDEIEGHTVAELVGKQTFEQSVKPLLDRALAGECITYDARFDFPTLGNRHTRVTYLPAYGAHARIIGVVVRVEDIDDLKQVELSLRRSVQLVEDKNIALQRIIQILSHDLREPVNTIINFAGLLQEQFGDTPAALRYVDFIHGGGTRLRTLLDDFMSYVSLERHPMNGQAIVLNDLVGEVRLDLYDVLNRTQAELVAEKLPTVRGEHTLLRVLLQNLIANAVKFVDPGVKPRVRVAAVQHDDAWELQVTDNGIGIAAEHREAVFDLFKRLHSQRQYEGTGLGLATCRRVAELHGGKIWVTAASQGGSCFHVLLPMRNN